MIHKCVARALNRFLESKRAAVAKLVDDLHPEEKAKALEAYFRLQPEQRSSFDIFMKNEDACRAVCAFLCYLAVRANENESVLIPENLKNAIDRYNEDCAHAFGGVDPAQTMALLSIEGLLEAIGFKTPCLLLVNAELPKPVFFALVNGISGYDGQPGTALVDQFGIGLDKNFNEYQEIVIPDSLVCELINHQDWSKADWILTRILFTSVKLSDEAFSKIAEHLFQSNDLTPLQLAFINSEKKPNTDRLIKYVEPRFKDSAQMGDPKYFYLYAALGLQSYEQAFWATNAAKTVCTSDDPGEVAVSLIQIALNTWTEIYNAGTMLGFNSGVTATPAFRERLLELLSGNDPCLFHAAYNCVRDLWCIGQFDNASLGQSEIVRKALEYLCSPTESIRLAAAGILGMMPFKTRLPSKLCCRFFSCYKRVLRTETYDPRVVMYFRVLVCCGAWRYPGQLVERYKQVYQYYVSHKDHVGRVEELLLQLTRQELPQIDKSLQQNTGTPVEVLQQSLEMPTIFDICYLSSKADRLLEEPDQRLTLTAEEAQAVITIALRQWLGLETKHFNMEQIKRLLSQSDLPENVGSFIVVQWFQQMCNYDCPAAVAFYEAYKHVMNRPCFYSGEEWKCTFTKFAEFLQLPSRVEMVIAEALMVSRGATVPQLFAAEAFAPASLLESTRKTIADMLEKRKNRELPVAEDILTEWLDLGPNLVSMPAKAWARFYDDQGVAQLTVEADTECHETVLEFGYGANETVAAAALRKDPLWSLSYIAAGLQNNDVIKQALRDGIKNLTAEDDGRKREQK